MRKERLQVIRVTSVTDYWVGLDEVSRRTSIDGRTVDSVVDEWFKKYPLYMSHATRDTHRIGYSEHVTKVDILPLDIPYQVMGQLGQTDMDRQTRNRTEEELPISQSDTRQGQDEVRG